MLYLLNLCNFVAQTSNNTPLPCIYVKQFVKTEKQNSLSVGKFDWHFMDYHTTPEFDPLNNLTSADNVYSFRVILLEIVTNKPVFDANRPKNERNLVEWVKTALSGDQSKLEQIIDPMSALWVKESAMGVLALSRKCIEEDPNQRPSTSKILKELAPVVEEHSIRVKEFLEKERQEEIQVQRDAVKCDILLRAIGVVFLLIVHLVAKLFNKV